MKRLPPVEPTRDATERFVAEHLAHLTGDETRGSSSFSGGQSAADAALAAFDVTGYAGHRNEVWPPDRRGASKLSPYIRHGLLHLPDVWQHVEVGPRRDVDKFRDELLWQEYARHWYARLGSMTARSVRNQVPSDGSPRGAVSAEDAWPTGMACFDLGRDELDRSGWLVNQQRMWLAGQWSSSVGARWQDGEDHFFRHLLDGSRAANRLGWQWVTGAGSSKPYLFSRWQVERRAPGLCARCEHRDTCPIEHRPPAPALDAAPRSELLRRDPQLDETAGPADVVRDRTPEAVWLTAESLGLGDPALSANPELPAHFVFDERLLASLRLSSKRLVFLVETLAELGSERELHLWLADPVEVLEGLTVAVTFAPVPGFRGRAHRIRPAELHPWPWLRRPIAGSITSFSTWRRSVDRRHGSRRSTS